MATTTSITTTYAGQNAGKYISAALLSGSTIANGGIEVKPNIKFKEVIKRIATDAIVANATCDFTSTSTVTLTERIITPEEFQVNLEFCKKTFKSDWEAVQMGYSSFDNLPPAFADFILAHVVAKVAEKMENNIWKGVNATAGEFDGLVTLATADAAVIDVASPVSGGITAANVIGELGKLVDAIPAALYGKEDLKIYVSQNIAKAYVRALGGFSVAATSNNGTDNKGTQWYNNGELSFDGIPLFIANGLSNNVAIAAQTSNLFFATGLMNDMNEVRVIDMAENDGSQNVRVIMRFTADVKYGFASDVVSYGI